MKTLASVLLPLVALPWSQPVAAQAYPSRPIELVVHTGPGGGADLVARVFAEIVAKEKLLSQPLVVQNRAGGGGAIAQTFVAGKRGDPYVVQSIAVSVMLSVPIRTGLDVGLDKFHPLGMVGVDLNALTVREDSPYRTVKDFVEAARANPKTINIAVGSIGATAHHFVWQLEKMTGARFNVVSMKSGAEAATTLLGGHVHATAENVSEVMPHVEAKKLRLLGVPSGKRLSALPNVPTLKEQGYDITIGAARGFAAPAGIPREAAAVLEDMIAKAYKTAAWRDYMKRNMYEEQYMNGQEFGRYLAVRYVDMNEFLTDVGLAHKK